MRVRELAVYCDTLRSPGRRPPGPQGDSGQLARVTSTDRHSPTAWAVAQSSALTARARSSTIGLRTPSSANQADTVAAMPSAGTWTVRLSCKLIGHVIHLRRSGGSMGDRYPVGGRHPGETVELSGRILRSCRPSR